MSIAILTGAILYPAKISRIVFAGSVSDFPTRESAYHSPKSTRTTAQNMNRPQRDVWRSEGHGISTPAMKSFRHFHELVAGFESSESSDTDTCFRSLMGSPDAPHNESLVFLRSRVIPLFWSISAFWRVREATCILGNINLLRFKFDSSGWHICPV
jgi:hypothetical protein